MADGKEILQSKVIQQSMDAIGRACRSDWSLLGNAHILLTGGTGFFGSWILVSFCELRRLGFPIEMTVLSRDPESFLAKNPGFQNVSGLTFRKGDVTDATIPFSVTHIFHLATAGAKSQRPDADRDIRRVIVEGTRHMLAEAKRVGAGRFLLASSGAVYGKAPLLGDGKSCGDQPLENFLRPDARLSAHGLAKREAEELCRLAAIARDIDTVIARGFTFSGPLFPVEGPYAISNFLGSILSASPGSQPILQIRNPTAIRSFLDGRDLVVALWHLLTNGKSGEAYNVGSDESVSMSELGDLVRSVAWKVSLRVPELRIAKSAVTQAPDIYRPSIAKMNAEFGWRPTISIRESLQAQVQWAIESKATIR